MGDFPAQFIMLRACFPKSNADDDASDHVISFCPVQNHNIQSPEEAAAARLIRWNSRLLPEVEQAVR